MLYFAYLSKIRHAVHSLEVLDILSYETSFFFLFFSLFLFSRLRWIEPKASRDSTLQHSALSSEAPPTKRLRTTEQSEDGIFFSSILPGVNEEGEKKEEEEEEVLQAVCIFCKKKKKQQRKRLKDSHSRTWIDKKLTSSKQISNDQLFTSARKKEDEATGHCMNINIGWLPGVTWVTVVTWISQWSLHGHQHWMITRCTCNMSHCCDMDLTVVTAWTAT